MNLPQKEGLPINLLSACFKSTSATYKYYWFLSIIEAVEEGKYKIQKKELFAGMIANAWYTVNYFKVSFGKQDVIQDAVSAIKDIEKISIDEKRKTILQKLIATDDKETFKKLWHFDKNVPHWFQSSWFPKMDKGDIYKASTAFEEKCIYALYSDEILINPIWVSYLVENSKILKDFCYWNLTLFLQTRNPNVPDIPNKLIKPAIRGSLKPQMDKYWKNVFNELGSIDCIFTNQKLSIVEKNFHLDHFIPHNFISHDLIWNLLPIESSFNTQKSDKLPIFEKHFENFYELQKVAFEINKKLNATSKFMEEFTWIFNNIDSFDKTKFSNTIQPLITIASNNGFHFMND